MIGGMIRHMKSLRGMQHDGGWIHHLLEEAENERMHLFTFIQMRNPGILFRLAILFTQGFMLTAYSTMYLLSSRLSHRFVGYLEEEAVKTYTNCIKDIDDGKLPLWQNSKAPEIAIYYWGLQKDAKFRDALISIRADECMHREVNHHFADLGPETPFEQPKVIQVDSCVGEALKDDFEDHKKKASSQP
eukprot:TRINITY_DN666_c0_g1_i4.p1 TRINITY_DN666_c0_g1~~TRINITY_DN666_c0_g1_i4.p1  ORF type:complete len:188 (+),score=33.54 TRINITY_DN666_c0_g1_i4:3-566(+)